MVNYYKLLEIAENATNEEIEKAYKKKTLTVHPDKNNGVKAATELFTIVTEAKNVLLNAQTRLEHDYNLGIKQRPQPIPKVVVKTTQMPINNSNAVEAFFGGAAVTLFLVALFNND